MELSQEHRDKIRPKNLSYIILNHLQLFDDRPDQIKVIIEKFEKIKDNPLYTHKDFYEKAYNEYYDRHKKFPDIGWIKEVFPLRGIKIEQGNYSTSIYEDFIACLDEMSVKALTEKLIVENKSPSQEEWAFIIKAMTEYTTRQNVQRSLDKEGILNLFDNHVKEYKGVKTHIKEIDELIGVLGYKSVSVVAAPSGEGKTTLAQTIAYNAAAFSGLCVDYVTFEVPIGHIWFNLASIESTYIGRNIQSRSWKKPLYKTPEEEQELRRSYRECQGSLLDRLNKSGGFLNPIDYTTLNASTFEELLATLERNAENRKGGARKADLIVIDNVDGLELFKSPEKDPSFRVNSMIRAFDQFSKTYYNNEGTHILLLSQVNREGMFNLKDSAEEVGTDTSTRSGNNVKKKKKAAIDVRCLAKYNALYERADTVLIISSCPTLRAMSRMHVYPVKTRNDETGDDFIKLNADFAHSKIGGEPIITASQEGFEAFNRAERSIEASEEVIDVESGSDFDDEEDGY